MEIEYAKANRKRTCEKGLNHSNLTFFFTKGSVILVFKLSLPLGYKSPYNSLKNIFNNALMLKTFLIPIKNFLVYGMMGRHGDKVQSLLV